MEFKFLIIIVLCVPFIIYYLHRYFIVCSKNHNAVESSDLTNKTTHWEMSLLNFMYEMGNIYYSLKSKDSKMTDMPHTEIFSYSRFEGRKLGFLMALICERIYGNLKVSPDYNRIPSMIFSLSNWNSLNKDWHKEIGCEYILEWEKISNKLTQKEQDVMLKLHNKIISCPLEAKLDCKVATTGSYEGMIIYMKHLPLSTLCEEADISLHYEQG